MKIIGLTGGMGAGKGVVARIFSSLGVPVFYADKASAHLLEEPAIAKAIADKFGNEVLTAGGLPDKKKLASVVFADPAGLEWLNGLLHPLVREAFDVWLDRWREQPFVLREAAILFETGSDATCDRVITVRAPEALRIRRCMKRDGATRAQVEARLARQWNDAQRAERADYEILNDDQAPVLPEVLRIHAELLRLSAQG